MRFKAFFFVLFLTVFIPSQVRAGAFYIELGAGAGQIWQGENVFGSSLGAKSPLSFAGEFSLIQNFSSSSSWLQIHIGAIARYQTLTTASQTITFMSASPLLRLDTPRIYIGAGATPFVWQQDSAGAFLPIDETWIYSGQVGLLWRIVPFFNMALELNTEVFKTTAGMGPKPAWTGLFVMRFYFDEETGGGGGGRRGGGGGYDGWRYPFGIPIFGKSR